VYQTYVEEVLDHWLRGVLGISPGEVWDYVAARVAIDYRSELRLDDREVVGSCSLVRTGNSSVTLHIELRPPDGRLAAEAEVVIVTSDRTSGESRPLTAPERQTLEDRLLVEHPAE
jgi:acyl-CoA thioesterase FadM